MSRTEEIFFLYGRAEPGFVGLMNLPVVDGDVFTVWQVSLEMLVSGTNNQF